MNQKGFTTIILLVGLLLILVISISSYFLYFKGDLNLSKRNQLSLNTTNSPNPTLASTPSTDKSWSAYKNDSFGYAVNYPNGWYVSPVGISSFDTNQSIVISATHISASDFATIADVPDKSVYIESVPIPIDYTFEQWWNDHQQSLGIRIADSINPDYSKITFPRDKITLDATDKSTGRLEWETLIIWKNNYAYIISAKNLEGVWNDKPLGDIVSSFTPEPNSERLNWHTYNSPLGFSIQVPNIANVSVDKSGETAVSSALNGMLYDHFGRGISLTIGQIPNLQHLSVKEWYRQALLNGQAGSGSDAPITPQDADALASGQSSPSNSNFGVLSSATFGAYSGYSTLVFGGDHGTAVDYIANGNYIYAFSYEDGNPNISDTPWERLVEQKIVSSVKFQN